MDTEEGRTCANLAAGIGHSGEAESRLCTHSLHAHHTTVNCPCGAQHGTAFCSNIDCECIYYFAGQVCSCQLEGRGNTAQGNPCLSCNDLGVVDLLGRAIDVELLMLLNQDVAAGLYPRAYYGRSD